MFDTLFCNARIVDGTGTPWFWGSLGVQDGFVAAVLPRTTKPLSRLDGMSPAPMRPIPIFWGGTRANWVCCRRKRPSAR